MIWTQQLTTTRNGTKQSQLVFLSFPVKSKRCQETYTKRSQEIILSIPLTPTVQ